MESFETLLLNLSNKHDYVAYVFHQTDKWSVLFNIFIFVRKLSFVIFSQKKLFLTSWKITPIFRSTKNLSQYDGFKLFSTLTLINSSMNVELIDEGM